MSLHDLIILQNKCEELEQKLADSEADWLKMRDIAQETQRKLDESERVNALQKKVILDLKELPVALHNIELEKQIAESQATLRDAVEVIRFYGKSEHWKLNRNNHAPLFSKCEDDLGEKARDFLAKIEGKKD